jgi:hypothetical protein
VRRYSGWGVIPDPSQVEPIGVPAGPDGDLGVGPLVGVPDAGAVEQVEVGVGQVEQAASEGSGELGGPGAVLGIGELTFPPKVPNDSLGWIGILQKIRCNSLFPLTLGS